MKKSTVILIWGGGTGIVLAVFYQVLNATGMQDSGLKWINLLLMFLGIFVGTMQFRNKANGGFLTYGQGFKTGFLMVLLITLIAIIATLVDLQIHPDMIDKILEKARANMESKGTMTDEQIEYGMHYTRMLTTPVWLVIWVTLGDLFFGTIISLITAGLNVKKKPMFDDVNDTMGNIPQA